MLLHHCQLVAAVEVSFLQCHVVLKLSCVYRTSDSQSAKEERRGGWLEKGGDKGKASGRKNFTTLLSVQCLVKFLPSSILFF